VPGINSGSIPIAIGTGGGAKIESYFDHFRNSFFAYKYFGREVYPDPASYRDRRGAN
jgi:hypothetical protein